MTLSMMFAIDDIEKALQAFSDRDYTQAMKLFDKACDGGNMYGCGLLGAMYYKGDGVEQNHLKSAILFDKACDSGDMKGCGVLGTMYYDGDGVEKDSLKGVKLFQKACDGGNIEACEMLKKIQ